MNLHSKAYNLSFQNIHLEFVCDFSNLRKLGLKLPGQTQKLTQRCRPTVQKIWIDLEPAVFHVPTRGREISARPQSKQ